MAKHIGNMAQMEQHVGTICNPSEVWQVFRVWSSFFLCMVGAIGFGLMVELA